MKAYGCADATSTLKTTLQNLQDANQDTYVLFVDIVKAFDSVLIEKCLDIQCQLYLAITVNILLWGCN